MCLISIVVPIYNVEKYLSRCLDSIVGQRYKNIEIILVDDGSTDDSLKICKEYQSRDDRIQVIHQKNGGLSAARNLGIDIAHGDYIAVIDSDDWVDRDYIFHMYELAIENDSDIVICSYYCVDRDYPVLPPIQNVNVEVIDGETAVYRCTDAKVNEKYNVAWNKLYRRKLFAEIHYPLGKIHEDEFTSYKIYHIANKITVTDKYLYYYYMRADSIMNAKFSYKNLAKLEAYWERIELLQKWNMTAAYTNMLFNLHWVLRNFLKLSVDLGNIRDESILDIKKQIEKIVPMIMQCTSCPESRKRYALYQYMSKEDIDKLQWKNPRPVSDKYSFVFPFECIGNNAKVILYGAGVMGKQFYEQISANKDTGIEITAWIDANWRNIISEKYKVQPLDRLLSEKYDYVVVAVNNTNIATQIAEKLVNWGVSKDCLIFGNCQR